MAEERNVKLVNLKESEKEEPKTKIKSIYDKLNDITVEADGSITHNVYKKSDGSGPRSFKTKDIFLHWKAKHLRERNEELKSRLTPLQYYITQGKGNERPFTGEYWWTKDVGTYKCVCCN